MAKKANIVVRVGGDTYQLRQEMRRGSDSVKSFEKSAVSSTSKISNALKGLAAAFAVRAVFKTVISATIEQEKAVAALEAALKSTGNQTGHTSKQLQDFASELQGLTTYGDESIIKMQALLATFKNIGGGEFKRAQEAILDVATAMGMDLTSAARVVGRALNDPEKGMQALSRYGIILSDDQKALVKNLMETGRAAEAQGLILQELEGRFKGAAAAARNTLGGAIEGLKNAFGDLFEGNGSEMTREINELIKVMGSDDVKSAAESMVAVILWVGKTAVETAVAIDRITRSVAEFFGRAASSSRALDSLDDYKYEISDLVKDLDKMNKLIASGRGVSPGRMQELKDEREFIKFKITELQRMKKLVEETGDPFGIQPATPKITAPEFEPASLADMLVPEGTTETIADRVAKAREAFDAAVAELREGFIGSVPGIGTPEELEAGRALLEEHYELVAGIQSDYQEQLNIDAREAANERIRTAIAEAEAIKSAKAAFMSDLISLSQSGNSKLAKIGKAAAIISATESGYESAVHAWKWGMRLGGPPLAAAFTGASLLKTAALISNIGGGSKTTTAANGTAAMQTQEGPSRVVSISFHGGDYERGLGERMLDVLNNEIARGGKISGVQMA